MAGSNRDRIAGYLPKVLIVFFNISKRILWCCFTIYHDLTAVFIQFISRLRFEFQMPSTSAIETVSLNKIKVLLIMEWPHRETRENLCVNDGDIELLV